MDARTPNRSKSLRDVFASLSGELNDLREKVKTVFSHVDNHRETTQSFYEEAQTKEQQYQMALKQRDQRIKELEQQVSACQNEIEGLRQEAETMSTNIRALNKELDDYIATFTSQ